MHILKKGKTFENLPESYVIFICAKDILKENKNIEKGERDAMTTYYDRLKKQWEKEGKAKGSAESESKMAKLMGFLVREGRIADIEKASESPDYRKALLQEFQLS